MRHSAFAIAAALLCAGCAGSPSSGVEAAMAANDEIICKMETPTGSHLPKRVCRHKSEIENDEATVRMMEDRLRQRGPNWENRPGENR